MSTLVERVRSRSTRTDRALTFVVDGEAEELHWSWAELASRMEASAAAVAGLAAPGDRVLLLYPQGLDYVAALLGCMAAGVLAVPLQPPGRHRAAAALPKLEAIAADGGVVAVLTVSCLVEEMRDLVGRCAPLAGARLLATDESEVPSTPIVRPLSPDDTAYLQYTSGSTSTPKGVVVSHRNLAYNLMDFADGYGHDASSVMVSWLPTFHDLGLVYGVFLPLQLGFRAVLLDPMHFLARPMRWLEAIDRHRGTHAPAPNFAFELCAAKSTAAARAALDLSCWKVALNGAEPIRHASEARFVEAFAEAGVRWATLSHAYGMSEATAVISKEPLGSPRRWFDFDEAALRDHRVVVRADGSPGTLRFAGCGTPTHETVVVAVHPETRAVLGEDAVGELWVGGPTRAEGYWNNPEASAETFAAFTADGRGPFLRTGDLGVVVDGQVVVTGRWKDLVILRGENHYPQDLEWAAERAHPALRPSGSAAFSVVAPEGERLVWIGEIATTGPSDVDAVFGAVREAFGTLGLAADALVLVPARTLFKTSSGKIMRRRIAAAWAAGELPTVATWSRPAAETMVAGDDVPRELSDVWSNQLAALPPGPRAAELRARILGRVAAITGLPLSALDAETPLRELGLDSVAAVELADALARGLGRPVDVTALFEYPTARELAAHLLAPADASVLAAAASAPPTAPAPLDDLGTDDLAALLRAELDDL